MRKERGFTGMGLMLVVNYMLYQMFAPAIYFGTVLCALIVFYCKIDVERMMMQGSVRFMMILAVCLFHGVALKVMPAVSLFVLCVLCSAISQRIQKSSLSFLENLSIINMILICVCFCGVLLQIFSPAVLMMVIALFQPSGLPVEIEGFRFQTRIHL